MATVDIIIPVYNRAALVREAIESALEAARELSVEIIVVDDASTDETWESLRAYDDPRIRCFRMDANGGQSAARSSLSPRAAGPAQLSAQRARRLRRCARRLAGSGR